jgi:hypothetical protein
MAIASDKENIRRLVFEVFGLTAKTARSNCDDHA